MEWLRTASWNYTRSVELPKTPRDVCARQQLWVCDWYMFAADWYFYFPWFMPFLMVDMAPVICEQFFSLTKRENKTLRSMVSNGWLLCLTLAQQCELLSRWQWQCSSAREVSSVWNKWAWGHAQNSPNNMTGWNKVADGQSKFAVPSSEGSPIGTWDKAKLRICPALSRVISQRKTPTTLLSIDSEVWTYVFFLKKQSNTYLPLLLNLNCDTEIYVV